MLSYFSLKFLPCVIPELPNKYIKQFKSTQNVYIFINNETQKPPSDLHLI